MIRVWLMKGRQSVARLGFWLLLAGGLGAQTVTTVVAPGTTPLFNGVPIINQFTNPYFLATDPAGTLYFTDGRGDMDMLLMRIAPGGSLNLTSIEAIANTIAIDPVGTVYLSRSFQGCIAKLGSSTAFAGICSFVSQDPNLANGDGGLATNARLGTVEGLAADRKGNVFLYEAGALKRIRVVDSAGIIRRFASVLSYFPRKFVIGPDDQLYMLASPFGALGLAIYRITEGNVSKVFEAPPDADLRTFAMDSESNFYFVSCPPGCSTGPNIVRVPQGGGGLLGPEIVVRTGLQRNVNSIEFDRSGNLFIAEGPFSNLGNNPELRPRILRVNGLAKAYPTCTITASATPSAVPASGGPVNVVVSTASSCSWAPRIGPGTNGFRLNGTFPAFYTGTQTLSFTALPNSGFTRYLELFAGTTRILVEQAGDPNARPPRRLPPLPQPGCTYTLNPSVLRVAASGGTQTVSVNVVSDTSNVCQYAITPSESWATYTGAAVVSGNRSINFSVQANTTTSQRGATVYIGASSVAVIQEAASAAANAPVISSVSDAAGFGPIVARNSFGTILGQNLAPSAQNWDSSITDNRLPTVLDGTRVYLNGLPAYLSFVSPTQINFLAPQDTLTGTVSVEVVTAAGTGFGAVQYSLFQPSFFSIAGADGTRYPAAVFANTTTFVAPVGAIPGVESRPARPGDNILLYAIGLGFTSADPPLGQVLSAPIAAREPTLHRLEIGSAAAGYVLPVARTQYVGLTFAGVYQVNFQIPTTGVSPGLYPLHLIFASFRSNQANVLFALGN